MIRFLFAAVVSCLMLAASAYAETPALLSMQLTTESREYFHNNYNPGSCVQCSIGMCGVWCNSPAAACLLWDTEYGERVRGGSWPSRVEQYCNERQIPIWSITGPDTIEWCRWAVKTGRFAAIGAGPNHFQTLYGYDYEHRMWLVCNNNSPSVIDRYTEDGFRRLHYQSGPWVVILQRPRSAVPVLTEWWK